MEQFVSRFRPILRIGILASLVFGTAFEGMSSPPSAVTISPGDNIEKAVEAAPEGTTFLLQAGLYRLQSVKPRNGDVFKGIGKVILNGSEVLSFALDPSGSGLWVAKATASTATHGSCDKTHPLCKYAQDLFIGNQVQTPVADRESLLPGSWYFDRSNNTIYIPGNPGEKLAELGSLRSAFYGDAQDVRIESLTVEKYATPAQSGAIGNDRIGTNWRVDHVESRWNHGVGVGLGSGSELSNSFIHHNGELGIAMSGKDCKVIKNELAWNNYAGFAVTWEAGGSKFASTTNLLVQSNYVHDNAGPGLWTDTNNVGTIYEGNTVINNQNMGIEHEISYDAIIRNNIVKDNGNISTNWLWNAQIDIQNSSNVEVYGNTVEVPAGGGNGIVIINQERGSGTLGPWVAANNYVHDNTIINLGDQGKSGMADSSAGRLAVGNRFDRNHYILHDNAIVRHWVWLDMAHWRDLQAAGQEVHGTCCK
jgi:hypothetical protein